MPHAEVENEVASQPTLPHVYSELLPNIRSVSLFIRPLAPVEKQKVTVHVRADGKTLMITQGETVLQLALPVKVANETLHSLPMTNASPEDLTSRLQPDPVALQALASTCGDNYVPWSSQKLDHCSKIKCASCATVIVEDGSIHKWQDLPSANWAEMMEFWHCHKPLEHEETQNVTGEDSKGYSAGNTLTAREGVGFVDTLSLLFSPQDCMSIKSTVEQSDNDSNLLHCAHCSSSLGVIEDASYAWKLYKWSLSVDFDKNPNSQKYLVEQWVTAELLSLMESHAARKFVVRHSPQSNEESVLLWLFTPDLWFSASGSSMPQRAIKVMWKSISEDDQAMLICKPGVEELDLPRSIQTQLKNALAANQQLLPYPFQRFQEWQVSLLRRFAPGS